MLTVVSDVVAEIYAFAEMPWPNVGDLDVIRRVRRGDRMEAPEGCPARVYGVMLKCWELQPARRLSDEAIHVQMKVLAKSDPAEVLLEVEEEGIDGTHL